MNANVSSRRSPLAFFLLVFALSIPFWVVAATVRQRLPLPMNLPVSSLSVFCPLLAIAAIAARTGVSIGLVALGVAWGLAAPILGGPQDRLVTGGWHWTIQVLHLVVSMGVIAVGRLLVIRIRRNEAAAGLSRRPAHPACSVHSKD